MTTTVKRLLSLALVVACAAIVVPAVSAANTSGQGQNFMSLQRGKSAIRSEVRYSQADWSTNFRMKIDICYKPANNKVSCFWQSSELDPDDGTYLNCFGTAKATNRWGYIDVNLGRGWINDCYWTDTYESFA